MVKRKRKRRAAGVSLRGAKAGSDNVHRAAALPGKATLASLVSVTSRLFARALHDCLVPHGVAPGQLAVLQRLWEGDGLTQAELARNVRVEQPTMARTLDRMARDGLIQRVPSKQDRRAFNVRLTARGKQLRRAVASEAARLDAFAVSALGKKDRDALTRLLDALGRSLSRVVTREEL